jgi:hypothetical protein
MFRTAKAQRKFVKKLEVNYGCWEGVIMNNSWKLGNMIIVLN